MAEIEELDSELFPLGSSPFHIVANSGDIKSVKLLLESSASKSQIDMLDRHGRTPLAVALQNGRFDTARVLIESGASLQLGFSDIPVSEALLATVPYRTFLETLIEAEVFIALSPNLLAHLAHAAAYDGRATFLLKLLGSYEIDIDSKDNLGQTSLHYASRRNSLDCIEILLRYGANVMVKNPQGSTALHLACIGGYLNIVPLLLQDWVVPDIAQLLNSQDLQGCTPLHSALYYKKLEVCEYIMSNYGSYLDLDLFDNTGYTTPTLLFMLKTCSRFSPEYRLITCILSAEEASWLLFEGVAQGDLELVNRSITSGAMIECMDHMQQTPLLLATKLGGSEVLGALLAAGADPNVTDQGTKSPLHYAYELGRLDIASHLLSLENLDVADFFDGYCGPLTTELLVLLIDHMSTYPSRRPKNWRKWLALVARNVNIPVSVFGQLVSVICPYDWVEHLPSQQSIVDSKEPTQPVQQVLPILVDGKSKNKHSIQTYQKLRSQRMPLKDRRQAAKEIGGEFSCMRQSESPKIFASYTPKHSAGPTGKTAPDKPFQFHFRKNAMTTFYPVHEAAYHGNTDVLDYLLMNARESSQSLLKQLIVETRDTCGLTVAELLAQHYSACRDVIIKLNIGELVMNAVSDTWPLKFNYMESLLHYIVSGG
jgi:ankyrin repeat protein